LRQSKKLKALSTTIEKPVSIDMPEVSPSDGKLETRNINGYENQCYEQGEFVYGKIENNNNQAIPLKQVIVSVDRITDHLSRLEGKEEESKILHEFFHSEPVQAAIEAIAVHRTSEKTKNDGSSIIANGTTTHNTTTSTEPNIHVVSLFKREDGYLGATVRNQDDRIVIGRVVKGGVVEKTGLLKEGDELLEMNGIDLRGKNVTEVCELLRTISGEVRFVVSSSVSQEKTTSSSSKVTHMRALFDYDPEDDIYVPCKELALKFQRGDILHVLSTDDENWWQAYREGDDTTQSLAGLIPSSSFHQQSVLCPPNTTFCIADLLTYEEVVLHLARTDRKRPLVLCGPEGVGCLELRQQLLESDRDRLAGPVPYTTRPQRDGEIDGIHYHFITKQRFLEDSKAGKFVEYGEYEKNLYGTAAVDIVNVIKRSKTCVLTLKAESLIAVRTPEIMPFILFVAPPSLQTLRRQKECAGQFNVKDEELKSILSQGKSIEQKFGHLFDCIIVNTDFNRSLEEMKSILKRLETEPQWVPIEWTT
uniref:Membrane protein, palmitoylated 1 n=1 Tax=Haemonchus placei TaxID=6290 RepID=A0A0N4W7T3_HAEPC